MKNSRSLKRRRFPVVFILMLGLLLGYSRFMKREPVRVLIEKISPRMNFSTVRIEGQLESDAQRLHHDSAMYIINDGTGTIPVFANLSESEKLPKAGSRVSVVGNLNVGVDNQIRIQAKVGNRVVILAEPVSEPLISGFKLADITSEREGERMTVYGRVSAVWKPRAGSRAPHKIVLKDYSGSLELVHWLKEFPTVTVGDTIEVMGTIDLYQGRIQLKIGSAGDIKKLGTSASPKEPCTNNLHI